MTKERFKLKVGFIIMSLMLVIIVLPVIGFAQEQLSSKNKADLIDKSSKLLIDNYVFPEVALKIEKHLKAKLSDGIFDKISDPDEFSKKLTQEMRSISKDKHMGCTWSGTTKSDFRKSADSILSRIPEEKLKNEMRFSFIRVGMVENNIGVLDIYSLPHIERSKSSVDEAMKVVSGASSLIIDLRKNSGGSPELIQYILSYLFNKPTHINSIYWRHSNKTEDFITFEKVDGKKMSNIPVFILTSSFTFSGGEEFAYDIQTQKRGILIGEVTGGGANPGNGYPLGNDFWLSVPIGRAINPITKTNWEGVGVKPDIEVEAAKAFEIAISKIQK